MWDYASAFAGAIRAKADTPVTGSAGTSTAGSSATSISNSSGSSIGSSGGRLESIAPVAACAAFVSEARADRGEGVVKNNFYASKAPIDPHLVPISLKILDGVTSLFNASQRRD